jgi:hypothetical protein
MIGIGWERCSNPKPGRFAGRFGRLPARDRTPRPVLATANQLLNVEI